MPVFIPRSENNVPTTVAEDHPGNQLMRHYQPRAEGVNVYLLTDGSLTEDQPVSEPETVARVYFGACRNRITFDELDVLAADGYGSNDNGVFEYETFLLGGLTFQLVSGDLLLQSGGNL